MHFPVLQHHAAEHPGVFRDYLAADGIGWDAVQLQDGEALPSLDGYDAVWAMGGPMDVWCGRKTSTPGYVRRKH
jgi:hypothetical protein